MVSDFVCHGSVKTLFLVSNTARKNQEQSLTPSLGHSTPIGRSQVHRYPDSYPDVLTRRFKATRIKTSGNTSPIWCKRKQISPPTNRAAGDHGHRSFLSATLKT